MSKWIEMTCITGEKIMIRADAIQAVKDMPPGGDTFAKVVVFTEIDSFAVKGTRDGVISSILSLE